ncbi:MAG: hypothetical protein FH758_06200 [Firmicutes bacterium]|nr:hypothetical protein [Bacillota bacterium]
MNNKKIAYLLVVHKSPNQVNLFLEQLLNIGDCDIYIHVDTKSDNIMPQLKKDKKIHIYSEFDVKWGSFEIVESAIFLMRKIQELGKTYEYIYFGSGQDLITRNGLLGYLDENKGNIFIQIDDKPIKNNDRRSSRFNVKWPKKLLIRNDLHLYRFVRIFISILCKFGINLFPNKKRLKKELTFYQGRTWFIIPYEVMIYINNYLTENGNYIDFWRDSLASDLMFFQTLIMNSPYKNKVHDELMYVQFGTKFRNMNHPHTITIDDIEKLKKSNKYFARKFEEKEDYEVIKYYLKNVSN